MSRGGCYRCGAPAHSEVVWVRHPLSNPEPLCQEHIAAYRATLPPYIAVIRPLRKDHHA